MNRNRRLESEDENTHDSDKLEATNLDLNEDDDNCVDELQFPDKETPSIGMEFETEEKAYDYYYLAYAKRVGFGVRSKSHNDKSGKIYSRIFVCSAEGKREEDARRLHVKAPRAKTRCGCMARMKVNSKITGKFRVIEFVKDHNHYVTSPRKTHLFRSHRKISPVAAMQIQMAHDVGIQPKASHDLMVRQAGGIDNLGFIPEDYKNYLRTKRTREMQKGDTGGVLEKQFTHLKLLSHSTTTNKFL